MTSLPEFLVHIEVLWPADGDPTLRDSLVVREREAALRLREEGTLRRLWRVPGRWANWGIWQARDADALHEALSSLPFYPWLRITVHSLATHPSDPGAPAPAPTTRSED